MAPKIKKKPQRKIRKVIRKPIRRLTRPAQRIVSRHGSIIHGGGVSKPDWMSPEEYGEYRTTAEYAHEVSRHEVEDVPDFDDMMPDYEMPVCKKCERAVLQSRMIWKEGKGWRCPHCGGEMDY